MSESFWVEVPRDVVMVDGPDAGSYLQSQLAQDLSGLAVGAARWSLLLEPNGRVTALVRVLRSGDHAHVVDVDAGWGDVVAARLSRFKIRVQAEITTIPWRLVAVRGATPAATGAAIALPAWWGDDGVDLLGPAPEPPAGVRSGTLEDLEAARITAGWPAMGAEITEASIPAELGLTDLAVSFTKGCYPGQELVERMDSRGASAPRHLARIEVAPGTVPGDPVVIDGHEVGRITSVAGTQALALLRRGTPGS